MSYIRMSSEGNYVDIPGESKYYIYDNGEDISGWSYGEFAALIVGVVDEINWEQRRIKQKFEDHFGEPLDYDYRGSIAPPERAEIFCQCVDSRIDNIELSDELQEAVQEWVAEFDAMRECEYCGEEFRPRLYNDDTIYVCGDRECEKRDDAKHYAVDVATVEKADRIFHHLMNDYDWSLRDASSAEHEYLIEAGI